MKPTSVYVAGALAPDAAAMSAATSKSVPNLRRRFSRPPFLVTARQPPNSGNCHTFPFRLRQETLYRAAVRELQRADREWRIAAKRRATEARGGQIPDFDFDGLPWPAVREAIPGLGGLLHRERMSL